ncbi:hypothetical protein [Legionella brunensis]|uniref:hypothetical protein n=1 Tax=Legionella brunensis TaxID=29422 RepID=UPI001041AC7D|nr:hypothetical protein [Legionella brunensis]
MPKLKRKEISHILGLKDNRLDTSFKNEGWYVEHASESIVNRFKNLTKTAQLPFERIKSLSGPSQFSQKVKNLSIGDYHGFATRWEGHAFTLHAIKDKHGTHFVYINRGERHLGPGDDATVRVFTVPDSQVEQFSRDIYNAFASENRQTVSQFIEANKGLSTTPSTLQKSNQKVGNCSIANSNIAWHFQLASDYLKKHPHATYEQALQNTKQAYKELRKQDRIEAFKDLLALKPNANYSQDAHMNDVLQALGKLNRKSDTQGENYIQLLLQDKEVRDKLTRMLTHPDFRHHLDNFLDGFKGFNHREGIRKKMEGMRDKILSDSFSKLPKQEQDLLIQQDPSLQKYSISAKKPATKEQMAQLLSEFDSKTEPKWTQLIQDENGRIGIYNSPPHKPGIVTRTHKIELNPNGDFTVLNKPSFQVNTNKLECEKIINSVLERIPQDVITPRLKSVAPTIAPPASPPFLATNPRQIAQLLREIKEKDGFSWKELASDKLGRIGVDYAPPHNPGIITRHHKIELRSDGSFRVLNKYHKEGGISYVENTHNPQEVIDSVLKRIPQTAITPLLKQTPKPQTVIPNPSAPTELEQDKIEQVSRLIKHYATGNWKELADNIEFGIGYNSKLPSMAFHNYQLMVTNDPNKPLIFLDKAQNYQPVNDSIRRQILDTILMDSEIKRLQAAVPSALDKVKVEQVSRLIEHYATGNWQKHGVNFEFGIGKNSQLPSLVFQKRYQLMLTNDPNKPFIMLDKAQGYKTIDDVVQRQILDEILNDSETKRLQEAIPSIPSAPSVLPPVLDKVKVAQVTSLIHRYATGSSWVTPGADHIQFGIGKNSKLPSMVFGNYQLMVSNDPSKPLIFLDKSQGYKKIDEAQQEKILDLILQDTGIKQLQAVVQPPVSPKKPVPIIVQPIIPQTPLPVNEKPTTITWIPHRTKGAEKEACLTFKTQKGAQEFAAQWQVKSHVNPKGGFSVFLDEDRINQSLSNGSQTQQHLAQALQKLKHSIENKYAYQNNPRQDHSSPVEIANVFSKNKDAIAQTKVNGFNNFKDQYQHLTGDTLKTKII